MKKVVVLYQMMYGDEQMAHHFQKVNPKETVVLIICTITVTQIGERRLRNQEFLGSLLK
jgi:hypothetical protein